MTENALNSYLFVIDSSTMSRDDAMDKINEIREVENWQKILPDAAVLISRLATKPLNDLLRESLGNQRYIVAKLGSKNGWLAKNSWDFMNNPTSVFE